MTKYKIVKESKALPEGHKGNPKHGMRYTRAYKTWENTKTRCYNPKHPQYMNYGGRGITMCDKWKNSFTAFWDDMKVGYKDDLTIDRIDNDKGYSPDNCEWVTLQENNRRKVVSNKCKGNFMYEETSIKLGGSKCLVSERIKAGWTREDAFNTPVVTTRRRVGGRYATAVV